MIRLAALFAILMLTGCTLAQQGAFDLDSYGKRHQPMAFLVGDGVTDDTADLQALVDTGNAVLPPGTYKTTAPIYITNAGVFRGAGMNATHIVYHGTGTPIVYDPTPATQNGVGWELSNMTIRPAVAGGGTFGVLVDLQSGAYCSNFSINRVRIGDFGSYGLRLSNDIDNADGFFRFTVSECWITNGINGSKIGDSVTIRENTITGRNVGILMSGVPGARQYVIKENNITNSGGSIALIGCGQASIRNNQCEHPSYLGDYTGSYSAQVFLYNCAGTTITENTISPSSSGCVAAGYALIFNGCVNTVMEDNSVSLGEYAFHAGVTANCTGTTISTRGMWDTTPAIYYAP